LREECVEEIDHLPEARVTEILAEHGLTREELDELAETAPEWTNLLLEQGYALEEFEETGDIILEWLRDILPAVQEAAEAGERL
jgi:hypothetical protein